MSRNKYLLIVLALIAVGLVAYVFKTVSAKNSPASSAAQTSTATADSTAQPGELWSKRCNKDDPSKCEIFQRLVVKESSKRLIEFAVGYPQSPDTATAVVVLPLGIIVASGITVKIDDQEPSKVGIKTCNNSGCFAEMTLSAPVIESMKKGQKITVSLLDGSAKQINIEMSLKGFAEKLATVKG